MEIISGKIVDYNERGEMVIHARYEDARTFAARKYENVRILLEDGRGITAEQRKKIYAMIGEIADWAGDLPELQKQVMKVDFKLKHMEYSAQEISLSSCSVTLASDFISYLVDFILANEIPTKVNLIELCEDIRKYVYACARHKKCAVCGKRAELHHIDRVGMGRDRKDVCHKGMEAVSLCHIHHDEAHTLGDKAFLEKYHLNGGVKLDEELCKVYKLKGGGS